MNSLRAGNVLNFCPDIVENFVLNTRDLVMGQLNGRYKFSWCQWRSQLEALHAAAISCHQLGARRACSSASSLPPMEFDHEENR
jgi:hypothetical protein